MSKEPQVLKRMDALVNRAKLAVCYMLMQNFVAKEEHDKAHEFAAAITNEIFGEEPQENHAEQFRMDEISKAARALVMRDSTIKVLAVQTVRVMNVIRVNHDQDIIGQSLLKEFGSDFPNAPSPDTFEQLVSEYEVANGVEHRLIPNNHSSLVNDEIQALRQEKPWYLWPFRFLFWAALIYLVYWIAT